MIISVIKPACGWQGSHVTIKINRNKIHEISLEKYG